MSETFRELNLHIPYGKSFVLVKPDGMNKEIKDEIIQTIQNRSISVVKQQKICLTVSDIENIWPYTQSDIVSRQLFMNYLLDKVCLLLYLESSKESLSHKLKKEYLLSDSYGRSLIVQLKNKINLTMMQYDEQNIILFHIGFWECIVLAERLYCHKMKIYNPGFKHILKQKNFLRRFDLNDIDLKNVYTIKMKEILEKLNELYKEGKN